MSYVYIIQVLVFLIAIYLGRHDAPACDNFSFYGTIARQQKLFHSTNWKVKFLIILSTSLPFALQQQWLIGVLYGFCGMCIMWPTFNIALNLTRMVPSKRPWYYISLTSNKTDVWLKRVFGVYAGKYLTYLCALYVVLFNLLLLLEVIK